MATVIVHAFIPYYQRTGHWEAMAWWVHDHLPYSAMLFFPKFAAFNLGWREVPKRRITSFIPPRRGLLTKPGMANYSGDHSERICGVPAFAEERRTREANMPRMQLARPAAARSPGDRHADHPGADGRRARVGACGGGLGAGGARLASLRHADARKARAARSGSIRAATNRGFLMNFFCHKPPEPTRQWRSAGGAARENTIRSLASIMPCGRREHRMPFDEAFCELVEEVRPKAVSFHFGLPRDDLLERVRKAGCKLLCFGHDGARGGLPRPTRASTRSSRKAPRRAAIAACS